MSGPATSGYVADLPVRLNKKFYPLPSQQNGFRDRVIDASLRYPAEALSGEYDFSAEKRAVEDFQTNLQRYTVSASKIEPPQSDIDSSVESESSGPDSTSSSCSSIPASEDTPSDTRPVAISYPVESLSQIGPLRPISATLSSLRSFSTHGILQPVIAKAPETKSANKDKEEARPVLRLEEFENVPCNPFDMVELKCINDIEELRRLWMHPPNGYTS